MRRRGLEDTRREAVITNTSPTATPVYDLLPERDTLLEVGVAHDFGADRRAYVNAYDRTVVNVLDTTNLLNTPLFAVYNSAIGVDARDRGALRAIVADDDRRGIVHLLALAGRRRLGRHVPVPSAGRHRFDASTRRPR